MKKSLFSNIFKFAMFFMAATIMFTACKDDDDDDDPAVIVLDGYYVMGDATAITEFKSAGLMKTAKNEVGQAERASLYEKYIAIKGGEDFHIKMVAGATQKTYGPGTDFAEITNPTGDEPHDVPFWRGALVESETAFTVPEDGLYHVVMDEVLMKVVIARVKWGVIGAATPGGWGSSTQLTEGVFSKDEVSFELTNVLMNKADWKFRYSNGWKIELDTADSNPDNHVKINTNFGGSLSALAAGGDNIANDTRAFYTINMTWSLDDGHVATLTNTGAPEPVDYSAVSLGLIGDGLVIDGNAWNWDGGYNLHTPTVDGRIYTWEWTGVGVSTAGSFKLREGDNWDGYSFGYPQVTMAGANAGDFETNGDGNFVPKSELTVNITFEINDELDVYTFTVDAAK